MSLARLAHFDVVPQQVYQTRSVSCADSHLAAATLFGTACVL